MADLQVDPWLSQRLAASVLVVKAELEVEAAVRAAIAEWLQRVRELVLGSDGATLTAAGPPNMGGFSEADPSWLAAIRRLLLPTLGELFGERFLAISRTAVISDQPYRERYLDQVFSRLKLFPAELFEEIRPEIAEALSEGEGVNEIRDRISAVLDFDQTRGAQGEQALSRRLRAEITHVERELERDDLPDANRQALRASRSRLYTELHKAEQQWQWKSRRIARTEIMGALNGGSHAGAVARAEIQEETLHKQWLSTRDARTRPSHVVADGQIRPLLDPFDVGDAKLEFPGDPTGPPHEIIQCRCTPLYLDDDEVAAIEAEGGDLDIRRAPQAEQEAAQERGQSSLDDAPPPAGGLPDDLTVVSDEDLATAATAAFETGDDATAERVIAELDRRDQLDAGKLQAADDAVAAAAEAPDAQAAVAAVDDGWNQLGEAWGQGEPAPWAHDGPDPEPISEGPGYRYNDETDEVHEDPDVPGGWVLAEDPHTGARSFYEATGVEKPARLTSAAAKQAREAYGDWVELQYLAADATTRGNLLSKAGIAAGVSARELFSGPARRARKYASEELLRFWSEHPRMTQVEYLFQATGDEKYRAAATKARELNAKELISFALVAAARKRKRRKRTRPYTRLQLVRAYWAGRDAAADEQTIDACPHTPDTDGLAALLWVRGFNDNRPDAVTAGGDMTEPAPDALPNGWRGHIAMLDGPTGDGRILATPPEGVRLRQPPRPLMYQRVTAPGHDGAVVASRIDRVWREGNLLWGEGPFNLESEDGRAAAQSLRDGMSNGVSADPDDVTWTETFVDQDGKDVDIDGMDEDQLWERFDSGDIKPIMVMSDWRLMGATMVAFPAFDEARLEALYDYVPPEEQQPGGPIDAAVAAAGAMLVDDGIDPTALFKPSPAAHYANPKLDKVTPLTVLEDGRVFGHIAPWAACHIGFGDTCTVAPKSATSYAHFHLGEVVTDDGRLPVGKLTLGGGHADTRLGHKAAIEHYDDTSTAVAAVRAGEDKHGIWVAGRLLSTVTAEQVELLLLSPPSGDWRRIGGNLEMVAVHSVNVPGFQNVRSMAASAGGVQTSLVAAGARTMRRAYRDRARIAAPGSGLDYRKLAAELAREQREYAARQQHVHRMAVRLGRDPKSRAAAAAARIGLQA